MPSSYKVLIAGYTDKKCAKINLGDYIQSIAQKQFYPSVSGMTERENIGGSNITPPYPMV